MPFYTVDHSYPLEPAQKTKLAEAITRLHTSKFLAPSMFVHVIFKSNDASDQNYFIAGKPRTTSTNRITCLARTSPSRKPEHWEELAAQMEEAWYDVVDGEVIEEGQHKGQRKEAVEDTHATRDAKALRAVAFYGLLGVRENGYPVPKAGEEAAWLQEYGKEFQRKADEGVDLFKELLEEVTTREDLKKAYGT